VIRSPLDASHLTAAVRQAVWNVDNTIPVPPLRSMDQALADAVGQPRFRAWLLGLFAATAILLAMTGLYGTMAYAAQQRTREIGLRIALGATPKQATSLLLRSGMRLAAIGIAIGLAGSVAVARALSTMLFGVGASDPATFVGVPVLLAVVATVACYLPARHARTLDPIAPSTRTSDDASSKRRTTRTTRAGRRGDRPVPRRRRSGAGTGPETGDNCGAAWAPSGDRIGISLRPPHTRRDVGIRHERDGANIASLFDDDLYSGQPAWSPDGRTLAISRGEATGDRHIFLVGADGTGLRQLTSGPGVASWPAWSQDGNSIAFDWDPGTNLDIYRVPASGGEPMR